ncbi:MAG TPA: UDP-N-acetylglucosamine 2-epimerase (non-hydrolyzing) [Anaerolineales bacterium]|nr:UDP-N-acetylglucosamine 2-epimerase (non-hydrolyzing) [Anaerolineales bacterium]
MVLKVMTVIGTRPEAIKMAPVIKSLMNYSEEVKSVVCVTAQHREMLDQALEIFGIVPDYDFNLMKPNQSLSLLTANLLTALDELISFEKPDWVLVQGDTTTAMVASLVAYYHRIKLGHVEAGLRTNDKFQPFPEEINRRIADILADAYFAPTQNSRMNLIKEGIRSESIVVTGNTVIDALMMISRRVAGRPLDSRISTSIKNKLLILVTVHRRESFGEPLENICKALARLALSYQEKIQIVYPVHLNPNVRKTVYETLSGIPNISLIEPVNYEELVGLMSSSYLILTDSGGIQEEAPSLHKPVLVLREMTERPEAIEAGAAKLIGTDADRIYSETMRLIEEPKSYHRMASAINPYGDGQASQRIVQFLLGQPIEVFG